MNVVKQEEGEDEEIKLLDMWAVAAETGTDTEKAFFN